MSVDKEMKKYKENLTLDVSEAEIVKTIKAAELALCQSENSRSISYGEFLKAQLELIQKKWWILQLLLLLVLGLYLSIEEEISFVHRGLGIFASLFVILIIPELWKNREANSMEIEQAAYFSLKQIYAARLLLFGIVDVALLSVFCGFASFELNFKFFSLMIHFLFPLCITTIICFLTLCSKKHFGEGTAITLCILWSALWFGIVLNERIFKMITGPIWIGLIVLAIILLGTLIYRFLVNSKNYWEVNIDGVEM